MTRRMGNERGASVVEFAIILPVLMLILFGIIEWSLSFKDSLTVASATRAGARIASTQARNATSGADFADLTAKAVERAVTALPDDAVERLWIYKAPADGKPPSTCGTNCVEFTWNKTTRTFLRDASTKWDATKHNACAGESDAIGVYLKVKHKFLTGYLPSDVTLTDHTVMVFEPIPSFQGCK